MTVISITHTQTTALCSWRKKGITELAVYVPDFGVSWLGCVWSFWLKNVFEIVRA